MDGRIEAYMDDDEARRYIALSLAATRDRLVVAELAETMEKARAYEAYLKGDDEEGDS